MEFTEEMAAGNWSGFERALSPSRVCRRVVLDINADGHTYRPISATRKRGPVDFASPGCGLMPIRADARSPDFIRGRDGFPSFAGGGKAYPEFGRARGSMTCSASGGIDSSVRSRGECR